MQTRQEERKEERRFIMYDNRILLAPDDSDKSKEKQFSGCVGKESADGLSVSLLAFVRTTTTSKLQSDLCPYYV